MLLSAVSVLVIAQSSSEIPEGLMNNRVYVHRLQLSGHTGYYQQSVHRIHCDPTVSAWFPQRKPAAFLKSTNRLVVVKRRYIFLCEGGNENAQ